VRSTPIAAEGRVAAAELETGISALNLRLNAGQQGRLLQYLALLEKWNRVYNLTAIREVGKMVSGHLLDCLAVVPHLQGTSVLDVGSGAGLPGIPIAIACPDAEVVLLDSNHKKSAFLRQALADLALGNASVACERVESWQTRARFDFIVSRAFADTGEFVQQSRHLLAPGGVLAAMKGVHPYEEIERLSKDLSAQQIVALRVPGLEAARHLVLIRPR
jgi:16S rRNA (guanine527-N7)-methyltransferase